MTLCDRILLATVQLSVHML